MQAPFHSSMSAPVCLLDVAPEVLVGCPQDLLALRPAGAATMASAHELVTIQSARAFTAALVLA